ncbi:MAG: hypothetical protein ABIL77_04080 [candidate division WOR-3 bacterium]
MVKGKSFLKLALFLFLLVLPLSLLRADYYTHLKLIPYGPFPSDYAFEDIWGITASQGVVYMAHRNRDEWKNKLLISFDNGKKWVPVFRSPSDWSYDFYIVDHNNNQRVYYYDYASRKLYRSDNYGKDWKDITPPYKLYNYFDSIAISPSNSSVVYIWQKYSALYISINNGDTWIDLKTNSRPILYKMDIYRLYVDVNNPYRLYIMGYLSSYYGGVGDALYIYDLSLNDPSKDRLTIGGKGLSLYIPSTRLRQNPQRPQEIWAFQYDTNCLYKSTDGGINFTKNLPDFCGEKIYQVKVNGTKVAIATNNGIKLSNDGGNSFSILVGGSIEVMDTPDFQTFYYKKNNQFVYYNGTEYTSGRETNLSLTYDRAYSGGASRTFRLNNFGEFETFIGGLGLDRIERLDNRHLIGYQEYRCYIIFPNGSYKRDYSCYDYYIYDYAQDYAYFVYYSDIRKIQISTGNLVKIIAQSARQVAVSRDENKVVISKSNTIYVSDDGGVTFRQTALSDNNGINDILVDRSNANNIIVAGNSGLYFSNDGGRTFTQKFSGKFWNIRQLPSGLILVMSTESAYESSDGGATWRPIKLPANYLVYDLTKVNNSYFFATDYGVVEVPVAREVLVLQPNGGQKWKAGSRYLIKWEAPLNSYKFTLSYSTDNKTTWTNIATVLASNRCTSDGTKYICTYPWTIPAQDGRKPLSFVRVRAFNSANQIIGTDDSDRAFSIEVLMVKSPNGGETLKVGSNHTITWETYALTKQVARVLLQYSTDGGRTWTNIKTLTGNPGQFNWTVPNTASTNCRVRVILRDSAGAEIARDISDRAFTIQP